MQNVSANVIHCDNVFSDILYSSVRCISYELLSLEGSRQNIDRRSVLTLTREEFVNEYLIPNKAVILTDMVKDWPAFSKWSFEFFKVEFGDKLFQAEGLELTFDEYYSYMSQCNEESPLYLFDQHFANSSGLANDFITPSKYFSDLFEIMGESRRPDYRWLICGPERSGSTFHIDPNSTSAWNAVIKGRKKWILYPPKHPPPGVYADNIGSNVTSPISLLEWYINFYSRNKPDKFAIEAICEEGELIFVPNRWWHSVLNLSDSIAVTQNFVNEQNLANVLEFIKKKGDLVSGFNCKDGDLYDVFLEKLKNFENGRLLKDERKMKEKSKRLWNCLKIPQSNSIENEDSIGFQFHFSAPEE